MVATVVKLPTLALDTRQVVRLLRASSCAQLMQSRTRVDWVPEPGAIQNVYGALCGLFGTPGTSEVVLPDMTRMEDEVRRMTAQRVNVFFDKCERGPGPAGDYLRAMEEIRAYSLAAIRETIDDQLELNRRIARAWGVGVERLAGVELVATVLVKLGGAFLPGPATLVDFGFDVAVSTLPDLTAPGQGKAIAFVENVGKEAAGTYVENKLQDSVAAVGEKVVNAINGRSTEAELQLAQRRLTEAKRKLEVTLERIAKRRDQVPIGGSMGHRAREGLAALEPRVGRYTEAIGSARSGLVKAGTKRALAKGVGFVFLAQDIMDAFEKYTKTVAAARE